MVAFDGGHVFRFADRHPSYSCQVDHQAAQAAHDEVQAQSFKRIVQLKDGTSKEIWVRKKGAMQTAIVKKRPSGKGNAKSLDRKKRGRDAETHRKDAQGQCQIA